jgi:hypothetical protein
VAACDVQQAYNDSHALEDRWRKPQARDADPRAARMPPPDA